ncbi:MAG: hypothetical protein EAZ28_31325 [Oscillatoriales cyanobacterium]|nr:MAG: hypothetical protein EAZ28_31325 [Oscillatoriales cyanobacterium]
MRFLVIIENYKTDREFQRCYSGSQKDSRMLYKPPDLSVESIPNRKSKILSSPEFIRGIASKI